MAGLINVMARSCERAGRLVVDGNFDASVTAQQLSLEAVTAVTHGVEFTAVLNYDRGKHIAAVVVCGVPADLGLAQLTKFLGVDTDTIDVNETNLTIWVSVAIIHERLLSARLASCHHLLKLDGQCTYYTIKRYIKSIGVVRLT